MIENAGWYLGLAIANLVGVLNIHHIVIAGSITRFGEAILEPIKSAMRDCSMTILADNTKVELSSLGMNIVIKGAASLLLANELRLV